MQKRHTPEQIIQKLRLAEKLQSEGQTIAQVCQRLGVSEQTFHRWRNQYGGMKADEARRLKELEAENVRLKRLVADLALDKQMLQEVVRKKILTAAAGRAIVAELAATFDVSQRRVCEVVGLHRSTMRQRPAPREDEARLVEAMLELVGRHPRYGYRRIWVLLVRAGWRVNRKRVSRLWKAQGLRVPRKIRKKTRLGQLANGCSRYRAEGKDHVWCWDFIHDRTTSGSTLKVLSVLDEYTRECLALEVGRSMGSREVIGVLAELVEVRGAPGHIRSDNGPEFIAGAIRDWLAGAGVGTLYVEPGSPWENGYAESFHSRVRDEFLGVEEFASVTEAKVLAGQWRREYNHERPHSSLGYKTPAEYGELCPRHDSAARCRVEDTIG
ncbi:IS3 family transposase [Tuwongella immobilis]|uniref:IS3 family transposase n=1 Tax=Tuwongella immobilis TaxID=692036 RepID=UPI001E3D1199|nr:IS3 family transposase [Tuwongella immobilis]